MNSYEMVLWDSANCLDRVISGTHVLNGFPAIISSTHNHVTFLEKCCVCNALASWPSGQEM